MIRKSAASWRVLNYANSPCFACSFPDVAVYYRATSIDMESRLDRQLDGPSHMHRPRCCVCR